MSFIDLNTFEPALLKCELVHSTKQPQEKPKVKITYGPARRAIAFITPAFICDWPRLTGNGNYGTKFGPTELDKAQYTVGVTNRALDDETNQHLDMYFNALRAIDMKLVEFVHANQKELLHTRDLTRDEVKGKLSPTVKAKYEEDVLVYTRQQLSARKFDYHGQEKTLKIVDTDHRDYVGDVHHEDVLMAAVQLECVFFLAGGLYGCKWAILEGMHLKKAEPTRTRPGQDIWANVQLPAWAQGLGPPPAVRQNAFNDGSALQDTAYISETAYGVRSVGPFRSIGPH
jgi:hypothetical protein